MKSQGWGHYPIGLKFLRKEEETPRIYAQRKSPRTQREGGYLQAKGRDQEKSKWLVPWSWTSASRTVSRYIFLAQSFQSAVFCFGSSTKCGLTMYVSFKKDGSHRFMNLLLLRLICFHFPKNTDFPGSSVVNNLPTSRRRCRSSIPAPGRSPVGGNGNPI